MIKKLFLFWKSHGSIELFKLVLRKLRDNSFVRIFRIENLFRKQSAEMIIRNRYRDVKPLKVINSGRKNRRINLVTCGNYRELINIDKQNELLFAILLSRKLVSDLQILYLKNDNIRNEFGNFIKCKDIKLDKEIYFLDIGADEFMAGIEISDSDIFIVTSWQTASSVIKSVNERNVIYFCQQDERCLYGHNLERYLCEKVLENQNIHYVVNSEKLFRHFISDGLAGIENNGMWYEPDLSPIELVAKVEMKQGKHRFVLFASIDEPDTLYYHALDIVNRAVMSGVLDLNKWDIYITGNDIVEFSGKYDFKPRFIPCGYRDNYDEIIKNVDVGMVINYGHSAGNIALKLSVAGALVVTNKYGDNSSYGINNRNICYMEPDPGNMIAGIEKCVNAIEKNPLGTTLHSNFNDKSDPEYSLNAVIHKLNAIYLCT